MYRSISDRLTDTIDNIKKYRDLKKKIDPASGITISVRRGAINDENQNDWITIESGDLPNLEALLDLLVKMEIDGAKHRSYYVREELKSNTKALEIYEEFLSKENQKHG